jgi:hypothetical protein
MSQTIHPTSMLKDHPLYTLHNCFNMSVVTLHVWKPAPQIPKHKEGDSVPLYRILNKNCLLVHFSHCGSLFYNIYNLQHPTKHLQLHIMTQVQLQHCCVSYIQVKTAFRHYMFVVTYSPARIISSKQNLQQNYKNINYGPSWGGNGFPSHCKNSSTAF